MSSNGVFRLTDVRGAAAAALAPSAPEDPDVLVDVVDSLTPPCLMLLWADPWLNKKTAGGMGASGYWDAWLEVLCIAGRLVPGDGMSKLEELVAYTVGRLQADAYTWPPETFYSPRRFDIGGITYLGARIVLKVPVTV